MRPPLPSFRRWCDARPWTRKAWAATVNVCVIFYGFYLLTWAPVATLVGCLKLSRHVGHGASETVLLGLGAKVAMGLVVVAALLLSSALAGFMRALFRGGNNGNRVAAGAELHSPLVPACHFWNARQASSTPSTTPPKVHSRNQPASTSCPAATCHHA
jgi:hypothetical protein